MLALCRPINGLPTAAEVHCVMCHVKTHLAGFPPSVSRQFALSIENALTVVGSIRLLPADMANEEYEVGENQRQYPRHFEAQL